MTTAQIILLAAGPGFLLSILAERYLLRGARRARYETRDTWANIAAGAGSQILGAPWALVEVAALVALYDVSPVHLDHGWAAWVIAMIGVDLAYYWYHRLHHESRFLWAIHVAHHSSRRYNLSVALRQPWVVVSTLPFLAPLAVLGVAPELILTSFAINLLYQFLIHTEAIHRMWAPIEFVFNTPSHHRVHHGSNQQYLDKNYGGILIVWDRLFRSFEPEVAPVVYGLTKNIETHNPFRIETHEWVAMYRDVRRAASLRHALGYVFRHPGWTPAVTEPRSAVAVAA
ncbi:MAG TPA: sterol desaturase family protein [Mycobacteriales bacterium]|nr:sterol desaturase family protein [Mycobacteriales bacterium]